MYNFGGTNLKLLYKDKIMTLYKVLDSVSFNNFLDNRIKNIKSRYNESSYAEVTHIVIDTVSNTPWLYITKFNMGDNVVSTLEWQSAIDIFSGPDLDDEPHVLYKLFDNLEEDELISILKVRPLYIQYVNKPSLMLQKTVLEISPQYMEYMNTIDDGLLYDILSRNPYYVRYIKNQTEYQKLFSLRKIISQENLNINVDGKNSNEILIDIIMNVSKNYIKFFNNISEEVMTVYRFL